MRTTRSELLLWLAAAIALVPAASAADPAVEPDAREAVGMFPIEDESVLVVKGIPGQVLVSSRPKARDVRFVSRATDRSGSDRPLGVWFEGATVTLGPVPGAPTPTGILRIEVPETFAVKIEASGGTATVDGLSGSVEVRAKDTEFRGRSLTGSLDVDAERGNVKLDRVAFAKVRARGAIVEANDVQGALVVRLEAAAKLTATGLRGNLEVDADESIVVARGVNGEARIRARGGSVELVELGVGGDLTLSGCSVKLASGKGDISVNSDAAVAFEKMTASLHFDLHGGSLSGNGNQGLVEVRTRNTQIDLQAIDGPVRIQGDGVKVDVRDVSGELYVETSISEVAIAKAGGGVALKIDRGNVSVQGAQGTVTATVLAGDAKLLDLTGPVALELDGGNAEVGWASISGETDTLLRTSGGDLTVRIPPTASCRVEATAKYGRIESELPSVRVLDGGREAQGPVGMGRRPVIKVEAEGNVRFVSGGGSPPPVE